nr:immunoglobulin light chain junction region [Macaca mulatta]
EYYCSSYAGSNTWVF